MSTTTRDTSNERTNGMELTSVHVDFKATVSDGNYGNETYSVAYTATLAAGESEQSAVVHLAGLAREHVYGALKHSPREGIRYALEAQTHYQPALDLEGRWRR